MSGANFRTGADAAQAASKGGDFARTQFFKLEDGESAILRFLTDAYEDPNRPDLGVWITVNQHSMVPTKNQPEGYKGKWPKHMGAVCRKDPAFASMFDECYICDHIVDGETVRKPSARVWALACLRQEIRGDGSPELGGPEWKDKVYGTADVSREVVIPAREASEGREAQPERKITEKAIVAVNMGFRNFFSHLQGYASLNGTILDRDFYIKRSGGGTDTTYAVIGRDPTQADDGILDLRKPEYMARYESSYNLAEIVTGMASDEFYARFFDPRYTVTKDQKVVATGDVAVEDQVKPITDVAPDQLNALVDRVKGYTVPAEAPAAPAGASAPRDLG